MRKSRLERAANLMEQLENLTVTKTKLSLLNDPRFDFVVKKINRRIAHIQLFISRKLYGSGKSNTGTIAGVVYPVV